MVSMSWIRKGMPERVSLCLPVMVSRSSTHGKLVSRSWRACRTTDQPLGKLRASGNMSHRGFSKDPVRHCPALLSNSLAG